VYAEALQSCQLGMDDVAAALALSDAAGWKQSAEDWVVFIGHGHVRG
jgi:hypothetical protein